ncbi:hypothetical protein C8E03_101733 [Lachnotalea glycerini]|uniref:Uncharacterized protein n=1 Tax=Lachnotalea glycerini TaxID=1763509 RepID=A0A318EU98_9FIRM|nr:hypothetical protein [Lachnotalea glycerini]PXV96100.1 hypothetical protein C8E03_101733 [Lachnotalea glycerini]
MRLKKMILGCGVLGMLLTVSIPIYADTVPYTITVNKSATNQDNLSKKVTKNTDGDKYFYVTPYTFNTNNAAFFAFSKQKSGSAESNEIYVENGIGETRDGKYKDDYAPGGKYYYMQTSYGYSKTGTVKSTGNYTP